jgi:S1-C subfamily serine protease
MSSNNIIIKTKTASALQGKEGVCRIEVSRVDWIVEQPWQRAPQSKSSGTGFCISGNQILTNAHVVRAAVDIRVRQHGSTRRFPARIVVYAPDVDLAILDIVEEEKADFFHGENHEMTSGDVPESSLALQFAEELPALQESVHVVGFPTVRRVCYMRFACDCS